MVALPSPVICAATRCCCSTRGAWHDACGDLRLVIECEELTLQPWREGMCVAGGAPFTVTFGVARAAIVGLERTFDGGPRRWRRSLKLQRNAPIPISTGLSCEGSDANPAPASAQSNPPNTTQQDKRPDRHSASNRHRAIYPTAATTSPGPGARQYRSRNPFLDRPDVPPSVDQLLG